MSALGYIFLAFTLLWLIRQFGGDVHSGMCTFLAFVVFMPAMLLIPVPDGFPQARVHRLLLLVALVFVAKNGYFSGRTDRTPYMRWLVLFGVAQCASLLAGSYFGAGLSQVIDYAMEVALFFVLMTAYIQREPQIVTRLIAAVCYALAAVAVLAALQKYLNFVPVPALIPDASRAWMEDTDIASTYPHRILFGYAMAMGTPIALAFASGISERPKRLRMYGIALLLVGGTYLSMSRGPWLGLGIALVAMAALGGKALRKKLALMALLTAVVLIVRPGVRDTITNLYQETFDEDSQKAGSYQTRWELWDVAWTEIRRTPTRFLFGLGPASAEFMDFTGYFEGEGSTSALVKLGHTSWDNNYASDLIEFGVVGFTFELILFASIARALFRNWLRADQDSRALRAGLGSSCVVFFFAMSNVFIFSPQLTYLFWTIVAIGSNSIWAVNAPVLAEADTMAVSGERSANFSNVPTA